jgi:hypothetical protein
MATQTPSEHRSDERAGKNAVWVIAALSAVLAILLIAVLAYYFSWY